MAGGLSTCSKLSATQKIPFPLVRNGTTGSVDPPTTLRNTTMGLPLTLSFTFKPSSRDVRSCVARDVAVT